MAGNYHSFQNPIPRYQNYNFGSSSSNHQHEHDGLVVVVEDQQQEESMMVKEQDRLLPIANVGRIMKNILPANAKVSKEAKETMQECVSEFISFVTGEASDKCHKEKRKTVNGDDICWAMANLGFDDYAAQLKKYLHRYRVLEGEKPNHHGKGGPKSSPDN
ncbi:Nuclear transcription factor Y subunit B-5 [Arabidopsis thaliana]|jgi:histone H3/H4|uniref:Nuclear transcription factor Y subunit B-5 n=4 Tax=Arabidopsis TaxID=3701 RepID=NFYB5_ARATH|nr:nuclear factor Y, subunit B5 [Arabidopsis thaliana]O82248.1 RecName: Full=Nuclear transcription factor Y subunit B-5; Short=AtNF-YB-5 [Arabidopsis thaliana]KAG7640087.1 Transcription factor CBF/NF-Y/archaeal histone domain [Arabidopsis thaliana x Arabidopsis arenosa]AAC63635.1 putative CCAAT-box binding trancription factor [Arabidopsis thaliana]AAO42012.1 putative CCAAT-box binding trancription factor [Arabidopsis thaliana]AAO50614.1 putative CCAAT-box binding trancription factor [Arabidops|eukprot:NP_182302.1 nuclear factor Y, subunit B5 [Arabidopsis thaliana]